MQIQFSKKDARPFQKQYFSTLMGRVGLYFIFTENLTIPYPFRPSRLIYIGMSESRMNSIGKRLTDHLSGQSDNRGIKGYGARWEVKFTYLDIDFLKHIFSAIRIEDIETYFLENFADAFGTYPICNNRRGEEKVLDLDKSLSIDWELFGVKHE
jgi:hypothetical protein